MLSYQVAIIMVLLTRSPLSHIKRAWPDLMAKSALADLIATIKVIADLLAAIKVLGRSDYNI